MTQLSDDDVLVTFLKKYNPVVPPASESLEHKVMMDILPQNRSKPLHSHLRWWGLGTVMVAGLAFSWTVWQRHQYSPRMAASSEEIETFLVESWQGTMAEPLEVSSHASTPSDWLLLGQPEDP